MKAPDLLVHCLEREGITHVFGVPGEENAVNGGGLAPNLALTSFQAVQARSAAELAMIRPSETGHRARPRMDRILPLRSVP